eukprot:TRINITY_DN5390_c7_g1_i1.p1 TRINITY_DN5390_c7_g1~~TRINITY_DN5390_c7_g1_i1.p1  ORF type:complete len:691 (+),score=56.18 TRINITY_DN5390_c7_g1_i1:57-2129(+)
MSHPEYCHICEVKISSEAAYSKHVNGTRHRKAMAKQAQSGGGIRTEASEEFHLVVGYVQRQKDLVLMDFLFSRSAKESLIDSGANIPHVVAECIKTDRKKNQSTFTIPRMMDQALFNDLTSGRSIIYVTPIGLRPCTSDRKVTQKQDPVLVTLSEIVISGVFPVSSVFRFDSGALRVPTERMLTVLNGLLTTTLANEAAQGRQPPKTSIDIKGTDLVLSFPHKVGGALGILHPSSGTNYVSALFTNRPCSLDPMPIPERKFKPTYEGLDWENNLRHLNTSQQGAVLQILNSNKGLEVIQGPPGTGKTTTAVSIIREWLRKYKGNILVTAQSNIGLDNITEKLSNAGLRCMRVGFGAAASKREFEGVTTLDDLISECGESSGSKYKDIDRAVAMVDVVCATCVGAGCKALSKVPFAFVLCDEATQATEPATLIPMAKGSCQVVLIGDHQQLPPTVASHEASLQGYGTPLFSRIAREKIVEPYLLTHQYRMHPAISHFSNNTFYQGRISDAVSPADRQTIPGTLPLDAPVSFLHCESDQFSDGTSFSNMEEAKAVVDMVCRARQVSPQLSIGVITPYAAQVAAIRSLLSRSLPYHLSRDVEVKSVDGFQGREKDIIALSLVRTSGVGFVSDPCRINVSLTRARFGLTVFGHIPTLLASDLWRSWILTHLPFLRQYSASGYLPLPAYVKGMLQ